MSRMVSLQANGKLCSKRIANLTSSQTCGSLQAKMAIRLKSNADAASGRYFGTVVWAVSGHGVVRFRVMTVGGSAPIVVNCLGPQWVEGWGFSTLNSQQTGEIACGDC